MEKGTSNGTVTDLNGKFSLRLSTQNPVLVFSNVGYKTIEIPVENRSTLSIKMEEDVELLEEVVVIGYGTMRKSDLTGSVASLSGNDVSQTSSGSFEKLLQGKVPGVQIINNSNDNPQGGYTVRIRGRSSINASNSPLVVVDEFH